MDITDIYIYISRISSSVFYPLSALSRPTAASNQIEEIFSSFFLSPFLSHWLQQKAWIELKADKKTKVIIWMFYISVIDMYKMVTAFML